MAQENSNKIKLLKIMELLRKETDEDHPLSRKALQERLMADGIVAFFVYQLSCNTWSHIRHLIIINVTHLLQT